MGGVEKPLQRFAGASLLSHVFDRLAPQVDRVVISANRHLQDYATVHDVIVADAAVGCGPLGGISAVAHSPLVAGASHLFVCPGDAPFLHVDLVSRLSSALEASDAEVAVPHDGTRTQHLFMLMRASVRESIDQYLVSGHRSVHGWQAQHPVVVVDAADIAESFRNINTMQDLLDASHDAVRAPSSRGASLPGTTPDLTHQDQEHS